MTEVATRRRFRRHSRCREPSGPSYQCGYACFPLLILASARSDWMRPRRAGIAAFAVCGSMALVSWLCLDSPRPEWTANIFPVARLLDFDLGMLLGFAWRGLHRTRLGSCSTAAGTTLELA